MNKEVLIIKSFEHVLGEMLGKSVDGIAMISDREIWFEADGEHYKIPTQNVYDYIHKDEEIDLVKLYDYAHAYGKTTIYNPQLIV